MEFIDHLHKFGLQQSQVDDCLFTYSSSKVFLTLIVYVDDLLITGTSKILIQEIKTYLQQDFTIKDMG